RRKTEQGVAEPAADEPASSRGRERKRSEKGRAGQEQSAAPRPKARGAAPRPKTRAAKKKSAAPRFKARGAVPRPKARDPRSGPPSGRRPMVKGGRPAATRRALLHIEWLLRIRKVMIALDFAGGAVTNISARVDDALGVLNKLARKTDQREMLDGELVRPLVVRRHSMESLFAERAAAAAAELAAEREGDDAGAARARATLARIGNKLPTAVAAFNDQEKTKAYRYKRGPGGVWETVVVVERRIVRQ
ncbi:hypothetical protein TeGR_g11358, partial [Tetraparma gracilis]